MLHNGSLILDDIEDGSEFRRNEKCVHMWWMTVNKKSKKNKVKRSEFRLS